jgi:hypothetical protein
VIFRYPGVEAMVVFDDGSGPALYVGGYFVSAGEVPVRHVARWDGWSWSAVGDTLGEVSDLCVIDDGSGPALCAATRIDNPCVARWDGSSWAVVGEHGSNWPVRRLAVFDDGSGPLLYAVGVFTMMDGKRTQKIARSDGSAWGPVGDNGVAGDVRAMAVFDDDSGSALYVGGNFYSAGGIPVREIARWDGESWSALGHEATQRTMSFTDLAVFDDGSGPALYGCSFVCDTISCPVTGGVLRWDGRLWHEVGGTFAGWPHAREVIDDGSGPRLYARGRFSSIGGEPSIGSPGGTARLGSRWQVESATKVSTW